MRRSIVALIFLAALASVPVSVAMTASPAEPICRELVSFFREDLPWLPLNGFVRQDRRASAYVPTTATPQPALRSAAPTKLYQTIFDRRLSVPDWDAFRAAKYRNGGGGGKKAAQSNPVQLVTPSITFGNLTKSRMDANFTLSPTSNSPGAFSFVSGNTGLVTISGNVADIVGTHGITTITAYQAQSGGYAAGNATMTLTVYHTYCIASPCITGVCIPTLEGALTDDNMVCNCTDANYSGDLCDEYDDTCSAFGYCNSGDCVADSDGGHCENCAPCLEGDRCQTAILNCSSAFARNLVCLDERASVMQ